jgi:hypothetical protein
MESEVYRRAVTYLEVRYQNGQELGTIYHIRGVDQDKKWEYI